MSELLQIMHEQFLEYGEQLKKVEKEIIRKYKAGEDCSAEVKKGAGLKLLQEECVRMMAQKSSIAGE